jgi:hypothetical protein
MLGIALSVALTSRAEPATTQPSMRDIIERLKSNNVYERSRARTDLMAGWDQPAVSTEDGILALNAAATMPASDRSFDNAEVLVQTARRTPHKEYLPVIVKNYEAYAQGARRNALDILASIDDPQAAAEYVKIVERHASDKDFDFLPTGTLAQRPQTKPLLFPRLLELAPESNIAADVYQFCLTCVESGMIRSGDLVPHAAGILSTYRIWREQILAAEKRDGAKWMWKQDQTAPREQMGVLLDLMGNVPTDTVCKALMQAIELNDPKLKFFAAISMLKLGMDVPREQIVAIAASDETRKWLFGRLKERNKLDQIPAEFRTQEALARSNMVQWLLYPTELGRPPDAIDAMGVATAKSFNGLVDFYVFRFRSSAEGFKNDGWMAGVSGGYLRDQEPTDSDTGDTFSTFEKAEGKSPAEHVERIRKLMTESLKENTEKASTRPAN